MSLTISDLARASFEHRRAAANDDRPLSLIRADVTVNLGGSIYNFPAVGTSAAAIAKSAEELAGDDPFGVTVVVQQ